MTDLYLHIAKSIACDEYACSVARSHDDETEPGTCHMVVSRRSAVEVQRLLGLLRKWGSLKGQLRERMPVHDVPVADHHELRILAATPNARCLEATVLGGGTVVAEILG